jgi:hypothetical protein
MIRQATLEALGVRFLWFTDEEILGNPEKVSQVIETWMKEMISGMTSPLSPLQRGGNFPVFRGIMDL